MKTVILAGGVGNRLAGTTEVGPKPLIEIGERPILWHVMSHYSHFGFSEFIVAAGYRGDLIKRYFMDYHVAQHDVRIHVATGKVEIATPPDIADWVVDVIDTGLGTQSGGRIKRLAPQLAGEAFMATFGDGVGDIDLIALLDFHRSHGRIATVTAAHPSPRFGELRLDGDLVVEFSEKPMEAGWVFAGYMVFEPGVFEYITGDDEPISPESIARLAKDGELMAYRHEGFFHGVDTLRDIATLQELWSSSSPPWKVW
jgi:glucose-1-phosphate cytidylyltransferase